MVAIGDVVGGKLRIERVLGEGAMGVVYEARDAHGERAAVKVLAAHLVSDADQRGRFEREARALARLVSPHAVRVFEVGRTPDGTPWYAMERLAGRTLLRIVEEEGPLPVAKAVTFVLEALDAIAEAHAAGVVHRDIKPDNLFLTDANVVKVLDFGIAKDLASKTAMRTATGDLLGTPAYMAPEQVRSGEPVDARTDVWAIGATLYELLTGDIPFRGASVAKILQAILNDPPAPIGRDDVPPVLEAIVRRCLAKDRSERFASARDLAVALAPFAPGTTATLPRPKAPQPAPAPAPPPRRALPFVLTFVVVLGVAGIVLAKVMPRRALTATPVNAPAPTTSAVSPPTEPSAAPAPTPSAPEVQASAAAPPPTTARAARKPGGPRVTKVMRVGSPYRMDVLQPWLDRHRATLAALWRGRACAAVTSISIRDAVLEVNPTVHMESSSPGAEEPMAPCEMDDARELADRVRAVLAPDAPACPGCEAGFSLYWDER